MIVSVFSFSYKRGLPSDLGPDGGGFVFDCRSLPNPFWVNELREFTGRDQPIIDFFAAHTDDVLSFLGPVESLVCNTIAVYRREGKERLSIGFGCTGGRHRSVYCAERIADRLRNCEGVEIELAHTVLDEGWRRLVSGGVGRGVADMDTSACGLGLL